ncbi:polyprenal reductase [Arctopsyche grandis]|uniref:polyprenal reductase n=1 Tax=Arctopsyche grandis TaxID=121162 RepID=UPI00406D66A5
MLSLIQFLFLSMSFATFVVGFLINLIEDRLPDIITQSFRYGKFSSTKKPIQAICSSQLPKSYFKHFYVLATLLSSGALFLALRLYIFKITVPSWLVSFLDFWCGENRQPLISISATVITLTLMLVQCIRRFYETFFIQVFAKSSKIFFTHYLIGHFHYFGCIVVILAHSAGFTRIGDDASKYNIIDNQSVILALPTIYIFLFAWYNQFESNKILANLRKDNGSRKVVSEKYFLPYGGWFDYVSCPHQFCEIVLYLSLTMLLSKNASWLCIVMWVLSNQIETALLSHWWYQKTFPSLPKERKALIPYVL